jgi:hypothetical protein
MAGLNCDLLFSYSNRREYNGFLNFRNVIALQVQRVYDATASNPPGAVGVPPISTGVYTGIIVNGTDFGSGRITSFSNPTSTDITENGRHLWKQIVNVEIYETGDNSNLSSSALSGLLSGYNANLQSLDEQFGFEITADGDYQYTHSANIRCADGVTGSVSGYITAQRIASGLLASTPPFGYIDTVHSGMYNIAVGRRIYSETTNVFDGSASFEERFIIQSRDFVKHNVAFDNGFMNISETYTIRHSGVSTVSGALTSNQFDINTRYSNAFNAAYTRCNSLYGTYAALIESDAYPTSLSIQPVQTNKIFDERNQELTYTVLYTNNPNMTSSGYFVDREQVIAETQLGVIQASENATLTAYNFKTGDLQSFIVSSINSEASGAQGRILPFYASIANLKLETESKQVSALGKKGSYGVTYSSDPSIINDGTFLSKNINVQNNKPIRIHAPYLIIGQQTPLVHSPDQTQLGTVNCSISANLVRPTGYSPTIPVRPDTALDLLFLQAINQALLTASAYAPTDTFVNKVSYAYDSNLVVEVIVELQYLFPKTTNI